MRVVMEVELIALLEAYQVRQGEVQETFYILMENGNRIQTEDNNLLILEHG